MTIAIAAAEERRAVPERRGQTNLWNLRRWGVGGRRVTPDRRAADSACGYLDSHSPVLFTLAVGTLVLSAADAHFTLELLRRGATEVNVFMAALMEVSVETFIWTKLALTSFAVVFLVAHERLRVLGRLRVANVLAGIFGIYSLLMFYELYLLSLGG